MNRRVSIGSLAAVLLGACSRGGLAAGSVTPLKPAGGAARDAGAAPIVSALQLPTPASPRADGKLTLIWFRDFV